MSDANEWTLGRLLTWSTDYLKQHGAASPRLDAEVLLAAARGCERTLEFARLHACAACDGSGARRGTAPTTCGQCRGTGQLRLQQGFFSIAKTCGYCGGRGTVVKSPCATCGGAGTTHQSHTLNVKVPGGVGTGSRLKLRGEGEQVQAGGPAGDLYASLL